MTWTRIAPPSQGIGFCRRARCASSWGLMALLACLAALPVGAQETSRNDVPTTEAKTPMPIAPDIQVEALWDGRQIVPFKALDAPKMVKAAEADFLDDDEYVLGVTVNGESRAYPTRFIWWHHVINDAVGDVPIAVTYCSVCNTGLCFDPVVEGRPIKLDFYGLYNGVVTLCERETTSVLLQVEGRFVAGSLLGKSLKTRPLLDTTWGRWKELHPDTRVMSPEGPFKQYYRPKNQPEPRGYDRFPAPFFRPTVTRGDKRLPPFEKVLGVALRLPEKGERAIQPPASRASRQTRRNRRPTEGESRTEPILRRAYPIKALMEAGGVLNDVLGQKPVVAFLEPDTQTACAFSRLLDGQTLTFEARKRGDGKIAFYDRETGSRWSIEGKADEGPLAGKSLERLENHLSQWYGWAAYYPETSLYGRDDPPQPGNPFEQ